MQWRRNGTTDGVAHHDRKLLENVVEGGRSPAVGATRRVLALGEMALESGDYAAARWYWERIVPAAAAAGHGEDLAGLSGHEARSGDGPPQRLVLVSILEGDTCQEARKNWPSWSACAPGGPRAVGRPGRSTTPRALGELLARNGGLAEAGRDAPIGPPSPAQGAEQDHPAGNDGEADAGRRWCGQMSLLRKSRGRGCSGQARRFG